MIIRSERIEQTVMISTCRVEVSVLAVVMLGLVLSFSSSVQAGDLTTGGLGVLNDASFYGDVVGEPLEAEDLPTNGLVLRYNFSTNENPVTDHSGSGYTGTVYGATWGDDGVRDGDYWFDAIDDYVNAGDVAELDMTNRFTIMLWAYRTNNAGFPVGFMCSTYSSTTNAIEIARFGNDLRVYVLHDTGSVWANVTGGSQTNTWQHYAIVYDGSGFANTDRLKIYVDGEGASPSYVGTIPTTTANSSSFFVGRRGNSSLSFPGALDEVLIYSRALDADEIHTCYLAGVTSGRFGRFVVDDAAVNRGIIQESSTATNVLLGRTGVGTNTPEATLHIAGDVKVEDNIELNGNWLSNDGGDEGVYVGTNGNVGIGSAAPQAGLHVNGAGRFDDGVTYLKDIGDFGMGSFTNSP